MEKDLAATHRSLWLGSRPRPATGLFFCGRLGSVLHFFESVLAKKVRTDPDARRIFFLPTTPVMVIGRAKIDSRTEVHWWPVISWRAVIVGGPVRIRRRGLIHVKVDFPRDTIFRREPADSPGGCGFEKLVRV